MKKTLVLLVVLGFASVAVAEDSAPAKNTEKEISNNVGEGLEGAGQEGAKHAPDIDKTTGGFGSLLSGIGQSIKSNAPDVDKAADNFGDGLEGAGKEVSGGKIAGSAE